MDIRFPASFHTHNRYCDGTGEIEDVVLAALDAGLRRIGITSHAPLPFRLDWTVPLEELDDYVREVSRLRNVYGDRIEVLLGAEIDYVPDDRVHTFQETEILCRDFQYLVGSVHLLGGAYPPRQFNATEEAFRELLMDEYEGDIRSMVEDYYARVRAMLAMRRVRIVGHLDHIKRWNDGNAYFRDDEQWYVRAVAETLRTIASFGHILELNTSGWRKGQQEPFPAPWILSRANHYGIPIIISSDAHRPSDVIWGFDRALACLTELRIQPSDPLISMARG